jgi:hypothetical protein
MLLVLSFDDLISVVMHDSSSDDVVTSLAKTLIGGIIKK